MINFMYCHLNAKINDHLFKYNKSNEQQIKANSVIDADTVPFLEKPSRIPNDFCFKNSAANRFRSKHDAHHRSNVIIVRIDFAIINNLSDFLKEMKNQFEHRTGIGSVQELTIINCKMAENAIQQIDVSVGFHSSLSHEYLNNLSFPTNWIFFGNEYRRIQSKQATMLLHTRWGHATHQSHANYQLCGIFRRYVMKSDVIWSETQ